MKSFFRRIGIIFAAFPMLAALLLTACGGGGSDSDGSPEPSKMINGTAAAGAPIVGYVSVRDSSSNAQPVLTNIPIEADGNYSVDVTGLTAPYAFLATGTVGGRDVSYYSAATAADEGGTINITPFTDLMIRNIAGTAVDAYLATAEGMASLTTEQLNAERVALTEQLAPALQAMGLDGSIDLLRASFNADSTGLDRFMDVVKVSTEDGTATITNILDAANTLVIDTTTGTTTGTLGTAGLDDTPTTPADLMLQTAKTFSDLFATSLPDPESPALLALFSSTFVEDGEGSSALLTELTSDPQLVGLKFSSLVIESINAEGTLAQVRFVPLSATGEKLADESADGAIHWQMKKSAEGVWQFDGNQRIAEVQVTTIAQKNVCVTGSSGCTAGTTYRTGLWMEIDNRGHRAIGKAVVTGPGLPTGGVTLIAQAEQSWFKISTVNPNNGSCSDCSDNRWYMSDSEIALVEPNSEYSVALYDNAATPVLLGTYTSVVPVAPVLNTAVASVNFPSLTGMTTLAGLGTATLTPAWTIPAGLTGGNVGVYVWQSGSANQSIWADVTGTSGTVTLAITAPPSGTWQGGGYWIDANDANGGQVHTNYQQ